MEYTTSRPRILGWMRSAALLDGDWGTSIAYVLGIAFALAGYSSFLHLSLMLGLTALVAFNYIAICRLNPNGGGVYSSVYHRSRTLAVIGALLLGADYVITMALSVFEACHYLDLEQPTIWAIAIILCTGVLNWYGPRHTGSVAFVISLATLSTVLTIIIVSAPTAFSSASIASPSGGILDNWHIFVGIILSISGIEAVSNMTGLMKNPERDSRKAILSVLSKVILATMFLGLAMHAVPNLTGHTEDMVRFLGEHYIGSWFGWLVAIALGMLLISAGNTALNGLISILFLMAVDKELPSPLRRLNRYGVPVIPLVIASVVPVIVLLLISDILTLAQLYAIGVVGAILINVASTATDPTVKLSRITRSAMLVSAAMLFFIEMSIALDKPKATIFASIVLATGLAARQIAQRRVVPRPAPLEVPAVAVRPRRPARKIVTTSKFLVALRDKSDKLLGFAIDEARTRNAKLFILRVKDISVGDLPQKLEVQLNGEAQRIEQICSEAGVDFQIISLPSNEVGYTIAEQAAMFGVDRVILGATQRGMLEKALKGNVIRSVSALLPEEIQLVIFGG